MPMKIRLRQKQSIANQIADFLKEEGELLNKVTYSAHTGAPVRYALIQKFFGTYEGLLAYLETFRPDAFPSLEEDARAEDPLESLSKKSTATGLFK